MTGPAPAAAPAEVHPAGFHGRVIAAMVDMMALLFIILQLNFILEPVAMWWYAALGVPPFSGSHEGLQAAAGQGAALRYLIDTGLVTRVLADVTFSFALYSLYALPFLFWKGATPGKLLLGQRIVMADTLRQPPRPVLVLRHVAYFASLLPLTLGFLWVALNRDKRGWHDYIANTRVILRRSPKPGRFMPPSPVKVLAFYRSLLRRPEESGNDGKKSGK